MKHPMLSPTTQTCTPISTSSSKLLSPTIPERHSRPHPQGQLQNDIVINPFSKNPHHLQNGTTILVHILQQFKKWHYFGPCVLAEQKQCCSGLKFTGNGVAPGRGSILFDRGCYHATTTV
ncbi:hypothetical protein GLYMA_01G083600v4 [Glycine max]|uniref:Uncharacterized protein n=2 Tax=Glycine subgen. Soja TaxID=1462606 RepID=A0A0R0L860_SOYBN|nr:hypothetical protein JHK85_000963 [Glycine max]KAG5088318.1 hypothetical protein JHK86_000930 [Glycine max]KAH1162196.1 hypothetical protein GYH30_000899 [Glycine max]KRH75404.1 hypothetical protein GLYMA_01G083600v4 [Glycine max]RZC29046.1 hypothetical protein D0Y65_000857 [Glycine soja]